MARLLFDRELQRMLDRLLPLGSAVQHHIGQAVDGLLGQDLILARRVIAADDQINEEQVSIEQDCLTLIARQQPTATDLRFIASVIAVASELERINDYAKGIGKITLTIGDQPLLPPAAGLISMSDKARDMLDRALGAFAARDTEVAWKIHNEDDEVDAMYNDIYRRLVDLIVTNTDVMDQATHLLWAAHNLERTADRVGNICERVVFVVSGELVESTEEMRAAVS